jgi:hypothetical protein
MFEKHISPPTNTPTTTARGVSWRSPKPESETVSISVAADALRSVLDHPSLDHPHVDQFSESQSVSLSEPSRVSAALSASMRSRPDQEAEH